jgi:hypothetical protein
MRISTHIVHNADLDRTKKNLKIEVIIPLYF